MTQGPIEPTLVEKAAQAIEDVTEVVDCWEYCYDETDPIKAAKAAIAVVLRELLNAGITYDFRQYARENGIEL